MTPTNTARRARSEARRAAYEAMWDLALDISETPTPAQIRAAAEATSEALNIPVSFEHGDGHPGFHPER